MRPHHDLFLEFLQNFNSMGKVEQDAFDLWLTLGAIIVLVSR